MSNGVENIVIKKERKAMRKNVLVAVVTIVCCFCSLSSYAISVMKTCPECKGRRFVANQYGFQYGFCEECHGSGKVVDWICVVLLVGLIAAGLDSALRKKRR